MNRELAWQSIETNQFGTDEYIHLCRTIGWTPMLTVNLGTGTPEEARNWLEYCNCPSGTRYAGNRDQDTPNYLAITNAIDRQIEDMDAVCRVAQAKKKSRRRAFLCFDEWNVRTSRTFGALDWLSQLTKHIPGKNEQMVRYYGY